MTWNSYFKDYLDILFKIVHTNIYIYMYVSECVHARVTNSILEWFHHLKNITLQWSNGGKQNK